LQEKNAMSPQHLQIAEKAAARAEDWQKRANQLLTSEEKAIQEQMHRLLTHPLDKVILTKLIDQSFRSHDSGRVADQVNSILRQNGVPDFFSRVERLLMQMFMGLGRHFPALSVPKMIAKMRENSSRAIIPGESEPLHAHLEKRRQQGVRMNINHLGEAVLGEDEARSRLDTYIADMKDPAVEYISVKISTIYSQISSLAFEHSVGILVERLSELYDFAKRHTYTRSDGSAVPKFVNLDMEEYRDLEITTEAFIRTLDREAFKDYSAGIVLQAYLPDSHAIQRRLTEWALQRVAAGGSPIKLRIVKGANMEMELVESSQFNWPLAPYDNKFEVDANYKRMVAYGMQPDRIRAVNLGIASHNLFDLAFAYELGREHEVSRYFYFEMLEGMADHVRRALREKAGDVLLYAPVATRDQFINAIAYLIRRLDENTGEENFLRYACNLKTGSDHWRFLKDQFMTACRGMDRAGSRPHRIQDRGRETFPETVGTYHEGRFVNEPDTDWSLKTNRQWAEAVRDKWCVGAGAAPATVPLVVDGQEVFEGRQVSECVDKSRIDARVCVARYALGNAADAEQAVATAKADPDGWREKTHAQRHEVLSGVAMALRGMRGDLMGAAAANTGKTFVEADVEISEAIDFAEYYPFATREIAERPNLSARGKGVGLVVSPWNFPIAIPCGGIVAALAAGNTVIFKPASDAVLVAWQLCQAFWQAGVSRQTLQFLPCSGSSVGPVLVGHPDVDFVILTGGTDTGLQMLAQKPGLLLSAETGGKNATIVTAMADRDQAIKNVLHSAFSNCGQKCSATSLLILEKEVYQDDNFKRQLVDAARSLKVGSAWGFENKLGPLIQPPSGDLKRALVQLEPGESWALEPKMVDGNPYLWTPGIKYGVQAASTTHMTEFFGPLLGVMCADHLDHAIELVNQTPYGLTSGIESLDTREQAYWKDRVQAGNLYVNRGTTGAITLRQPFGGMKKSALGPAVKAGGPNYTALFMDFTETGYPADGPINADSELLRLIQQLEIKRHWGAFGDLSADLYRTVRAVKSLLVNYERHFGCDNEYFHLRGQDNILRYLPVGAVVVRLHPDDTLFEALVRIAAAWVARNRVEISLPTEMSGAVVDFLDSVEGRQLRGPAPLVRESDGELIRRMPNVDRIRYAAPDRVPGPVLAAAAKIGFYIARAPVMMEGRIELIHYTRNQSICDSYHRYGNLGERAIV
jgi:RHH-type proline utilization regulon transcriptional repressor/proline dehydrogenase/delta 1-pyrroline-5-carboxylate dehydrogenase